MDIHSLVSTGTLDPAAAYLYLWLDRRTPLMSNMRQIAGHLVLPYSTARRLYKRLENLGLVSKKRIGARLYLYKSHSVAEAFGLEGEEVHVLTNEPAGVQPPPPPPRQVAPQTPAPPTPAPIEEPQQEDDIDPLVLEQMQKDEARGKVYAAPTASTASDHPEIANLRNILVGMGVTPNTPPPPTPAPASSPTQAAPTPPPVSAPPAPAYEPPEAWRAFWSQLGEAPWKLKGKMLEQLKEIEARYKPKDLKEDFRERMADPRIKRKGSFLIGAFFDKGADSMRSAENLPVIPRKPYQGSEWLDKLKQEEGQQVNKLPPVEQLTQFQQSPLVNRRSWGMQLHECLYDVGDLPKVDKLEELVPALRKEYGTRGRLKRIFEELDYLSPAQISDAAWKLVNTGKTIPARLDLFARLFDVTGARLEIKQEYCS